MKLIMILGLLALTGCAVPKPEIRVQLAAKQTMCASKDSTGRVDLYPCWIETGKPE